MAVETQDQKMMRLYGNDYQAEINRRLLSGKADDIIPILKKLRDKKLQGMYGNDYQAEINGREADDSITSDLVRLRKQKIRNNADLLDQYGNVIYPNLKSVEKPYTTKRDLLISQYQDSLRQALNEIETKRETVIDQSLKSSQKLEWQTLKNGKAMEEKAARMGLSRSGYHDDQRTLLDETKRVGLENIEGNRNRVLTALKEMEKSEKKKAEKLIRQANINAESEISEAKKREMDRQDQKEAESEKEQFDRLLKIADRLGWLNGQRTEKGKAYDRQAEVQSQKIQSTAQKMQGEAIRQKEITDPQSAYNRKREAEIEKIRQLTAKTKADMEKKTVATQSSTQKTTKADKSSTTKTTEKTTTSQPKTSTQNSPKVSNTYSDQLNTYKKMLDMNPLNEMKTIQAIKEDPNLSEEVKNRLISDLGLLKSEEKYSEH